MSNTDYDANIFADLVLTNILLDHIEELPYSSDIDLLLLNQDNLATTKLLQLSQGSAFLSMIPFHIQKAAKLLPLMDLTIDIWLNFATFEAIEHSVNAPPLTKTHSLVNLELLGTSRAKAIELKNYD